MIGTAREEAIVTRDVEVTAIPYGDRLTLKAGSPVVITQALGGAYTLYTMQGYMVRLGAPDADAIGKEPMAGPSAEEAAAKPLSELVWDQLRTCYDPEIPVNIVELGLVHSAEVADLPEGGHKAVVRFNLTAPGCGMGPTIAAEAKSKVLSVPGVGDAEVELVWDPPWNQGMISEAGQMKLGLI